MKQKLVVSVSGGRTSMYMARRLQLHCSHLFELVFIFANTGAEHPRTLEFVYECQETWGMPIVWLEALVDPAPGGSILFTEVDYFSASIKGEPFRAVISKYGIPNMTRPFCTKYLKTRPIYAYIRDVLRWGGEAGMGVEYQMVLGIRADEPRRLHPVKGKIYPLAEWWPMDKQDILDWWEDQPFDLNLPERHGNCVWCWKKSLTKHLLNLQDVAEFYEFPAEMEKLYGCTTGAGFIEQPHVFFREHRSTGDLVKLAALAEPDERRTSRDHEDSGCSESCEAF